MLVKQSSSYYKEIQALLLELNEALEREEEERGDEESFNNWEHDFLRDMKTKIKRVLTIPQADKIEEIYAKFKETQTD